MKILFVCSGNRIGVSPIIRNQGDSLMREGFEIVYYTIKGKGFRGYLSNVIPLKNYLKENNFDFVHAHFSLTAFVVSLAGAKPLVVSLMGSDVKSSFFYKFLIRAFAFLFSWKTIIVKSQDMYDSLGIKRAKIIPNGVNIERFKVLNKLECQDKLGWDKAKKHILFPANSERREKNYQLALDAISILQNPQLEIHSLNNVANEEMPIWYNAADIVLLTSLWEGSPNAIKEAMACCRPIVCTNVGDVAWLLEGVDNCHVVEHKIDDVVKKLNLAFNGSPITKGIDKIYELKLTDKQVVNQLIEIYK